MRIHRFDGPSELGRTAAGAAGDYLRTVLREKGTARIVLATGASQFSFLTPLAGEPNIDWRRVTMFHLDEYIGLPAWHPAAFRRFLQERFVDLTGPGTCIWIDGHGDPDAECRRLGEVIAAAPVDMAVVGIGENGHLAFNDPPADFETEQPFIVVELDEACRRQQVGEGWFGAIDEVPARAISMSIRQIMCAERIFAIVPGRRKAEPVRACLEEPISPWRPGSILREHPNVDLYLDRESASLLTDSRNLESADA